MIEYLLVFNMELVRSNQLQTGKLQLLKCDGGVCEEMANYLSTSGLPGYQTQSGKSVRAKGPIPDAEGLSVLTHPTYSSRKGIEGNFYPIVPNRVKKRSGFGIHADKNVPGTNGCVAVVDDAEWVLFQQSIRKLARKGIKKVRLIINYGISNHLDIASGDGAILPDLSATDAAEARASDIAQAQSEDLTL